MTARQLASDEPLAQDAVFLLAFIGGVLELVVGAWVIWALFAGG